MNEFLLKIDRPNDILRKLHWFGKHLNLWLLFKWDLVFGRLILSQTHHWHSPSQTSVKTLSVSFISAD